MKNKAAILILIGIVFSAGQAFSSGKVKVATFAVPALLEESGKGMFVELAGEIAKRTGLDFELSVLTPQVAKEEFNAGRLDVLFPAVDELFTGGKPPARTSEIIYVKRDFVFTLKGSPELKTLADLEGKTVGLTKGYPYVRQLADNEKIRVEFAATDEENLKKLVDGKVAAYVAEEKTGLQALRKAGLEDKVVHDSNSPISKQEVYFAVKAGGAEMAGKISTALKEMKADASFSRIMSKGK